ncbi:carbohydrate kinase [Edaphobacter sp. HDX4]|uniref:FGGY-family carbohydrate kinase n=1 Tax=Edaphobacter sp. HDX4 TaxID=2794064 RepID=UPI002FE62569
MAWLSVDVGTSVVKSVMYTDDGRELALARRDTVVLSPRPGFAEQDMNSVWAAVVATIREVSQNLHEPVNGISITAQGDGCWLVDAIGNPTGNAVLWNDGRAKDIIDAWQQSGLLQQAFEISGCMGFPGLSNAILRWLEQNDPDRIRRSRWVLSCNGWIFSKLTGRFVADHSDASNPFGDATRRAYSDDLAKLYKLRKHLHLLPARQANAELTAPLAPNAAQEIGIALDTPVIIAPYDIVTTAYGCGTVRPGQACVILGTTICTETITSSVDLKAAYAGTTIILDEDLYLRAMPTLTGCEALTWAMKLLSCKDLQGLESLAATAPAGANGVFFLPYLSSAGERAPFLAPYAHGSFIGLQLSHGRADMARAVYEGLAFVIRECLSATSEAEPAEIRLCGGGSRSDFFCQVIADVCGIAAIRTGDSEVGARGAFLFALTATGVYATLEEAAVQHLPPSQTFEPSKATIGAYMERYRLFLELRRLSHLQWSLLKEGD